MSKIQIYYFSGTGNTAFVVNKITERLKALGNDVDAKSCEENTRLNKEFDILGIAFPIHSSFAPKIFSDFLDKLPQKENTPFFAVVTSGYMAGDVVKTLERKLKEKGYIPFLYRNIVVGNNLHLPVFCPLKVTKQDKLDKRLNRINKKVEDIVKRIDKLCESEDSKSFIGEKKEIRGNGIIGKIFGLTQRRVGKIHEKINFKGFNTDEKCTKCQWCIKNCPTNNIVMNNGKVLFGDACIICMRCYNFCPKEAINMTKRTKNTKKYIRYNGPENLGYKSKFR